MDLSRKIGRGKRVACGSAWALLLLAATGCGGGHHSAPAPHQATAPATATLPARPGYYPPLKPPPRPDLIPVNPSPAGGVSDDDLDFVAHHKPILTEEGLATWYTAPYKGRKAANGQVFDDNSLTAAHRTLPMGSLIVVTNLKTGQSSPMRITDRGPFVEDRILDLTIASAKATGVYSGGLVQVRIDVYRTPKPIESGGRWCVQIGAFTSSRKALKLKAQLLRKYPRANVIEFAGQESYWVRIRPEGDDRQQAERIAQHLHPAEGLAFLTRLD